ncbi:glycosyltransferase [Alkalibacterium gilvum]|nr:glycosyltransferase [Alkalibacterium gilvum]
MSSDGGGISSFIKNKAIELKNSNVRFDVLTYDPVSSQFEEAIRLTGGDIFYMSNPKKASFVRFIREVNSAMNIDTKHTIVHSHIQGYRFIPFYMLAKKNNIKRILVHAHTDLDPIQNDSIESKLNRIINANIGVSRVSCGIKASKTIFGKKKASSGTIMHIPNSIAIDQFVKQADKKKLKEELFGVGNSNKKVIGTVARFNKQKNHEFMVSIIEELSKENVDFLWVFVGEGELLESIQDKIKNSDLEKFVLFMGKRNDVPELLKAFDLFALPSLYEGLPTVAIESQAAGTPILLSDSITTECDLGLELVEFLPLKTNEWVDTIQRGSISRAENKIIIEKLEEKKFTNEQSAKLYKDYLNGDIKSYEI